MLAKVQGQSSTNRCDGRFVPGSVTRQKGKSTTGFHMAPDLERERVHAGSG